MPLSSLLRAASPLALLALAAAAQAQDAPTEEAPAAQEGTAVEGGAIEGGAIEGGATGGTAQEGAAIEGTAVEGGAIEGGAAPTRDSVVASVNGVDITLGALVIAAAQLPPQYQQLPPDVLFGGLVDQLVQQELLAQTLTEEPDRVALALANERRSLLAGEVVGEIAGAAVTDAALQEAYDAAYAEVEPATEWNAAHILVATAEEAEAVAERLAAGEDFAAVAQEVSTDTGSGAQGGELGWFSPGMMVPEFEAGVAALEPGGVSEPVQSQFGFHVIRLNETRPVEAPTLGDVRAELEGEVRQAAIEARLAELEAGAEVTRPEPGAFDPALLSDLSLLED